MNHNPYEHRTRKILTCLDPNHSESRAALVNEVGWLLNEMGTTLCPTIGTDNGTLALLLVCQLLKEHGGALKALTDAHRQLHS